ncbi:MAG: F0F1 ATP synthase subunit A [Phycisphaerae bacterium]
MTLPSLTSLSAIPFVLADADPLSKVLDKAILKTDGGWFIFTNHMVMMLIPAGIMLLVFPPMLRKYRTGDHVMTGKENFFEALLLFVRNDVAKPLLGVHTDKFMPFLWTLFFFILINNLLGLLPLNILTYPIQALFGMNYPVYGTATGNIWVTGALALVAFLFWNFHGIKTNGFGAWAHHFMGGAPWYMAPVMVPVEILGMFVKPFALAIRLFANMAAGGVLIGVLIGFTGTAAAAGYGLLTGVGIAVVIGATAIMLLKIFVAFLQSYIFVFLTSLFLSQLVVHEHDEHDEHAKDHDLVGDMTDHALLPDDARAAGAHAAG